MITGGFGGLVRSLFSMYPQFSQSRKSIIIYEPIDKETQIKSMEVVSRISNEMIKNRTYNGRKLLEQAFTEVSEIKPEELSKINGVDLDLNPKLNNNWFGVYEAFDAMRGGVPKDYLNIPNLRDYLQPNLEEKKNFLTRFLEGIGKYKKVIGLGLIATVGLGYVYFNWRDNPVVKYAREKNLPPEIIKKLKLIDNKNGLYTIELEVVDELVDLGEYRNTPQAESAFDSMIEDGEITYEEWQGFLDLDRDWVRNSLDPNPIKVDADGGGLDDFNEIYTYDLNPNNPEDDKELIAKVPDVEPLPVDAMDGGTYPHKGKRPEISMRDPLVRWYAEHSHIEWETSPEGYRQGRLHIEGSPGYVQSSESNLPAYQLKYGIVRSCNPSSIVHTSLLRAMGYKTLTVSGKVPDTDSPSGWEGHGWTEAYIDGKAYVADFLRIIPREIVYDEWGWVISDDTGYNPDWYKDNGN